MISFSKKDERYLELAAKGFTDAEMSQEMDVSLWAIQSSYRIKIGKKIGLSTKGQIAAYARKHGYGGTAEAEDPEMGRLCSIMPGDAMAPARQFYKLLEQHYWLNKCAHCKSYHQYHVLRIPGDYYTHLERFAKDGHSVEKMLRYLVRFNILEEQYIDGICRLTFAYLQREDINYGRS